MRRWPRAPRIRGAPPLGGGTDLVVNIRRGIVAPKVLIDMNRVPELHAIKADAKSIEIGASVRLSELAEHPAIVKHYPVLAQAAAHIAGPTQRNMGTVGGNLCLDTRCIFYNQSEWWRDANNHCLKTTGTVCHVAPKSRGVCFATFSGDLAPALLTLGADVDIAGPAGKRTIPLEQALYRFCPPGRAGHRHARRRQIFSVAAPRRNRHRRAREKYAGPALGLRQDPHPQVDRISGRRRRGRAQARKATRSPICAWHSPAPIRARCCSRAPPELCGGKLDERVFKGLDALVRDQIMPMKTTFTPGHYRRRVAGVLARRLLTRLFES